MANTIITEALLQKETLINLDKKAVIFDVANSDYTWALREQGDTVTVQLMPDIDMDQGVTAGNDITAEDWAITSDTLTVDQAMNKNLKIKEIEETQSNLNLEAKLWARVAEATSRAYDQFTAVTWVRGVASANKLNEWSPATESKTTAFATMETFRQTMDENNVYWGWFFTNPAFKSLLRQADILDGFGEWYWVRKTADIWDVSGFRTRMTNNLPWKQSLWMATEPTADDTVTITVWGTTITFTFVASPSAAWDVDLWGSAAVSQANLVAAINWGSWAWSAYIEISAANRKLLNNAFVEMSDFSSDVAYLTAWKAITTWETFTDWTDAWGTASRVLFSCDQNSINVVRQLVGFKITDAEKGSTTIF